MLYAADAEVITDVALHRHHLGRSSGGVVRAATVAHDAQPLQAATHDAPLDPEWETLPHPG